MNEKFLYERPHVDQFYWNRHALSSTSLTLSHDSNLRWVQDCWCGRSAGVHDIRRGLYVLEILRRPLHRVRDAAIQNIAGNVATVGALELRDTSMGIWHGTLVKQSRSRWMRTGYRFGMSPTCKLGWDLWRSYKHFLWQAHRTNNSIQNHMIVIWIAYTDNHTHMVLLLWVPILLTLTCLSSL